MLDDVMGVAQQLNVSVEALTALGAELAHRVGEAELHPSVRPAVAALVASLDVGDLDELSPTDLHVALGGIRAFLLMASDLLAHPDRAPGWVSDDPVLLQSTGRVSMAIAAALRATAEAESASWPSLTAALAPGAALLDIGTGAGWLAVALATCAPGADVTGIDIHGPALALARTNVEGAGLADRVEIIEADACTFDRPDAFDLIWVPTPFLPPAIVPTILERAVANARPGGWVVFGLFGAPPDPRARALMDLRVVRAGGRSWTVDEARAQLEGAGCSDVVVATRTWQTPVELVLGRVPDA